MTNPVERAVALFNGGHNCAQATAAAFASSCGLDEAMVVRAMAGFGAGTGGLRETCGAVSAMVFVAGLRAGAGIETDNQKKRALYQLVRRMHDQFIAVHGTTCCRELLARVAITPSLDPQERTPGYHAERPCARFVATAAGVIERELFAGAATCG